MSKHGQSSPVPPRKSRALLGAAGIGLLWFVALGMMRPPVSSPDQPGPHRIQAVVPSNSVVLSSAAMAQIMSPWQIRADAEASGGQCLELPDGAGKPPEVGAAAAIDTVIPTSGWYRCWVRSWWQDACGNSLSVRLGNARPFTIGQDAVYLRWHWVSFPNPVELHAGPLRLEIQNREDGVRVDQVLLCPDLKFVPQGIVGKAMSRSNDLFFADDFLRSPETPTPDWTWESPYFKVESGLDPNGFPLQDTLRAECQGRRAALVGDENWRNYRVEASVRLERAGRVGLLNQVSSGSALLFQWTAPGADKGDAGELRVLQRMGDQETVLAGKPFALLPRQWYRLALEVNRQRIAGFVDGLEILSAPARELTAGRAGVEVEDALTRFDDFVVFPSGQKLLLRPIEWHAFTSAKVARSVFDDFTEGEIDRMRKGPEADLLRREDQYCAMIGADQNESRFTPARGGWQVANGFLSGVPRGERAWLMRNRPLAGDLEIGLRLRLTSANAAGGIMLEGNVAEAGHWVLLRPGGIELWPATGQMQRVAASGIVTGRWQEVRIVRADTAVNVAVNGRAAAHFSGVPRGNGSSAGLAASGAPVDFDDVEFSAHTDGHSRFYAFDRPETDWLESGTNWELHTGIVCQDASRWITCRAGPACAALWNKNTFASENVSLAARVFEHSVWYGWTKEHEHYVYAGFGLLLASDGSGLGSGYAAIIHPVNLGRTVLFRNGVIVAEADARQLRLVYRGGHAPVIPRGSTVCLRKRGDRIELVVNEVTAIDWRDPAPLAGGHAAIFAAKGICNWSDFSVVSDQITGPARFWPGTLPPSDVTTLLARLSP